jgi:hypothetical protein
MRRCGSARLGGQVVSLIFVEFSLFFKSESEFATHLEQYKVEGVGLMGGQDGQERRSGFHHPGTKTMETRAGLLAAACGLLPLQ